MHDIVTGALIALGIAAYFVWRKQVALKAREELAGHLENILTDKKIVFKEREKLALVYAWEHSASYKFFFRVIKIMLTPVSEDERKDFEKGNKEKSKTAVLLLLKAIWVNAKLMPITYLFIALFVFVVGVTFSTMSKITNRYKMGVSEYLRHPHIN